MNGKQTTGILSTISIIVVLTILVVTLSILISQSKCNHRILTNPDDLLKIIDKDAMGDVIIDLREKDDYEDSHIESAVNIPYLNGQEVDEYLVKQNARNKRILLICYSGKRSAQVFNYLCEQGYKNIMLVSFGYEDFLSEKGDFFVPATGPCNCLPDSY